MPLEDIYDWLKAKPFAPFRIVLTNGTTYEIHEPSQMWPGDQSALLAFPSRDEPWEYSRFATISLYHINNIDTILIINC